MKSDKTSPLSLLILISVLVLSCDQNRIFEQNINLPDNSWKRNNVLVFNVEITDTIHPHNIFLNIRNGGQYQFRNLYMFIKTVSPSGQWIRDTVECVLADEKGDWHGSGLGDIYALQVPYKRNVRFPYEGMYSFEIEQGMRTEELKQVFDIGLRVEKMQ